MTEYVVGCKGEGKGRMIFETAVASALQSKGNVVYLDRGKKLLLILPKNIRLIDINDYQIYGAKAFIGFLNGLSASDYDLTDVFVDSSVDDYMANTDLNDFFELVELLSSKTGVNYHFAVNDDTVKQTEYVSV